MQNTLFLKNRLFIFYADFCTENENRPPMVFGMRVGQEPDMIWTRKTGFQRR